LLFRKTPSILNPIQKTDGDPDMVAHAFTWQPYRLLIAAFSLLSLAGCAGQSTPSRTGHPTTCSDSIDTNSPLLANGGFAFDTSNSGNNPSQINSGNVSKLKLALTHAAAGQTEKRGVPAITQQAVFFTAGRSVIAMNRVSGCQYWSYDVVDKKTPLVGGNAVRSSTVYYLREGGSKPALILVGDWYANFYAIDAKTGKRVWSKFIGTDEHLHMITGGAQFYAGKLFVPIASKEVLSALLEFGTKCCKSHGLLQALDPYTGNIIWTYHTASEATLDPVENRYAPNGMSLWGVPAVDPARGSIYIGTGQNYTPPTTPNEDSIVALDINTGKQKWVFQGSTGDAWNTSCQSPIPLLTKNCLPAPPGGGDLDFGAPPILAHLANGKDAILAGEKSGELFSLNPDTGARNWSLRLGAGGNIGGIHWGMASDASRVYAGVSDVTVNKITGLTATNLANIRDIVGNSIEPSPNARPGVYAVDLITGKLAWEQHPTHTYNDPQKGLLTVNSIFSAALSVTNDVVFAASLDGVVKAYRASDGAELWSYATAYKFTDVNGTAGNGGTIDAGPPVPAGVDLLVNSGFDTFGRSNRFQSGPGNALFIFRLAQ
jgi:polyvinyl alcohol dehydrogenase (cytochrome)